MLTLCKGKRDNSLSQAAALFDFATYFTIKAFNIYFQSKTYLLWHLRPSTIKAFLLSRCTAVVTQPSRPRADVKSAVAGV